jgi:hypothetical protein
MGILEGRSERRAREATRRRFGGSASLLAEIAGPCRPGGGPTLADLGRMPLGFREVVENSFKF